MVCVSAEPTLNTPRSVMAPLVSNPTARTPGTWGLAPTQVICPAFVNAVVECVGSYVSLNSFEPAPSTTSAALSYGDATLLQQPRRSKWRPPRCDCRWCSESCCRRRARTCHRVPALSYTIAPESEKPAARTSRAYGAIVTRWRFWPVAAPSSARADTT